jgi:hypothetical protein
MMEGLIWDRRVDFDNGRVDSSYKCADFGHKRVSKGKPAFYYLSKFFIAVTLFQLCNKYGFTCHLYITGYIDH